MGKCDGGGEVGKTAGGGSLLWNLRERQLG